MRKHFYQFFRFYRFTQEFIHSCPDTPVSVFFKCTGSHCNNKGLIFLRQSVAYPECRLYSVHFRHLDIHENDIILLPLNSPNNLKAIGCHVGTVAHMSKHAQGNSLINGYIFCNEYLKRSFLCHGGIKLRSRFFTCVFWIITHQVLHCIQEM